MSKKKEMKKIFENMEPESSEAHPENTGSAKESTSPEGPSTEMSQADIDEMKLREEMLAAEQEDKETEPEVPASKQEADQEIDLRAEMLAAEQEQQSGQEPGPEGEQGTVAGETLAGEQPSGEQVEESDPEEAGEESPDDLLEDVRKSLMEEEAQEDEKQPKWWKRIGRSSRKKKVEDEAPQPAEEINLPALAAMQTAEIAADASDTVEEDEYQDQIDELIDMLDQDDETAEKAVVLAGTELPEPEPEPEKPVDLDELKKQAFQSRAVESENENLTEVRSIALEGEDVFVEVEDKRQDAFEERIDAVENALKPYRRYINFGFAFLGIVMAAVALFLIYNAYQRSVVQNAPTEVPSNVPYPTAVSLPGGWQFTLGKGSLTSDGNWDPAGAEWLQGTEVCRWVALPWSRQLEAVVRTLTTDDSIQLGMSNNDKLKYQVYSIKQMSPAEMRELDTNSPCLLIVLAEPKAEKRWVLTALP